MAKTFSKNSSSNDNRKKKNPKFQRSQEIVFDEAARADFLRGFHKRKLQRRTYGLAQQALKDRKSKLETRKERKNAQLEEIERSEQQKQELLRAVMENDGKPAEPAEDDGTFEQYDKDENSNDSSNEDDEKPITQIEMYRDDQEQWGGDVIVTTSTKIPGDDDSEPGKASSSYARKKPKHDIEQEYAGLLQKYMQKIKANLPKKRANHSKRKGQHGASKSVEADFKTAQKALNMAKSAIHKNKIRKR
jgi:ribosomal RNA-processing protein 17